MIAIIGDVHRSFNIFEDIVAGLPRDLDAVIQVGDLGLRASDLRGVNGGEKRGEAVLRLMRRVYWIDGNWDDFGGLGLRELSEPTELFPNLIYIPRGTVLEMDHRRVGFLGGAESIATETRVAGRNWWPELEGVSDSDVTRLIAAATRTDGVDLDLIVTHTPPAATTERMTGQVAHLSSFRLQRAAHALSGVPWVAGHMHRSFREQGPPPVTVLDELELIIV